MCAKWNYCLSIAGSDQTLCGLSCQDIVAIKLVHYRKTTKQIDEKYTCILYIYKEKHLVLYVAWKLKA